MKKKKKDPAITEHFRELAALFEAAKDDVRLFNINNYDWYRGVPIESPEGLIGFDREN
jgi:hypothetical protein